MATIDNLDIRITANADSAARALDRLASSAGGLRGAATRAGGGLRDLSAGAKDAGTATQEAGQQAGNAEKHTRNFGRASEEAGKAAKRGTAGIATFWKALKRVAYYRFIRTIIKTITSAFSDGIKNLYGWSSAVNGHFAKSMNQLATATNYLKNSLGAMVAPLIEALAPAVDFVIDKFVALLNVVNQVFAAIGGQDTYTVAKKVETTWGGVNDSIGDTTASAKELKRTLLGFDEINKLDSVTSGGGGGSGSGYSSPGGGILFEEKPLEGVFKKIKDFFDGWPDWLKWLFTGAALIGGFALIKGLVNWLSDKIKNLFSTDVPDWIRWLFGPKDGNDDGGPNIPDQIDFPDSDVTVHVNYDEEPFEPSVTDKIYVPVELKPSASELYNKFTREWESTGSKILYFSPKFDNAVSVLYDTFKKAWDEIGSKILYFSPKLDNTPNVIYTNFKDDWDAAGSKALYMSPKLDNTPKSLFDLFKKAWDEVGSKFLYFSPKLDNTPSVLWEAFKDAWNAIASRSLYATPKLDQSALALWNAFKDAWNKITPTPTVKVGVEVDGTNEGGFGSVDLELGLKVPKDKVEQAVSVLGLETESVWDKWFSLAGHGLQLYYMGPDADTFVDIIADLEAIWGDLKPTMPVTVTPKPGFGLTLSNAGEWALKKIVESRVNLFGSPGTGLKVDKAGNWSLAAINGATVTVAASGGSGFNKALSSGMLKLSGVEGVTVSVAAGAGTGFKSMGTDGKFNLQGIAGASVTVNGTAGSGISGPVNGQFSVKLASSKTAWITAKINDSNSDQKALDAISVGDITKGVNLKLTWDGGVGDMSVSQDWTEDTASLTGLLDRISKLKQTTSKTVSVKTTFANGSDDAVKNVFSKNYQTKGVKTQLSLDTKNSNKNAVNVFNGEDISGKVKLTLSYKNTIQNFSKDLALALKSQMARGGVFQNGVWSSIPQYAGGTANAHGSLFLAGEAGPELVGHVGGRTEVLNRSQLAATMFSAVRSAMNGVRIAASFYNGGGEDEYDTMYSAMYDAFTAALAGSAERDKEKVQLLRQISAKDTTVEVTANSINRANQRVNRRAGTTIVPVGV